MSDYQSTVKTRCAFCNFPLKLSSAKLTNIGDYGCTIEYFIEPCENCIDQAIDAELSDRCLTDDD